MKITANMKKKLIKDYFEFFRILMLCGRGVMLQEHMLLFCKIFGIMQDTKFKCVIKEMQRCEVIGIATCNGRNFIYGEFCVTKRFKCAKAIPTKPRMLRSYFIGEYVLDFVQKENLDFLTFTSYMMQHTTVPASGEKDRKLQDNTLIFPVEVIRQLKNQSFIVTNVHNILKYEERKLGSGNRGDFLKDEHKEDADVERRIDLIYADCFDNIVDANDLERAAEKIKQTALFRLMCSGDKNYCRKFDVVNVKIMTLEPNLELFTYTEKSSFAATINISVLKVKSMVSENNTRVKAWYSLDELLADSETQEEREARKKKERVKNRKKYLNKLKNKEAIDDDMALKMVEGWNEFACTLTPHRMHYI